MTSPLASTGVGVHAYPGALTVVPGSVWRTISGVVSAVVYVDVVSPPIDVREPVGIPESIVILIRDGVDVLPTLSVAVIESVCTPSGSVVVGVNIQFPEASAGVVPSVFPELSLMVIVLPGSAVPDISGVLSAVAYGRLVSPPTDVTTGEIGAVVSIVNAIVSGVPVLPIASTGVITTFWIPSERAVLGVHDQLPELSATAVQTGVPPLVVTVMVAPDSAVPMKSGVVLVVVDPPTGVESVGAAGAVESIVNTTESEGDILPRVSISITDAVCVPSESDETVNVQFPDVSTVPVSVSVPMVRTTVAPTSPVPVIVGVVSVRVAPPRGERIVGAVGAVVSTVIVAVTAGEVLPTVSTAVIERILFPSERALGRVIDQFPDASTVPVAIIVPRESLMYIVLPASAVPVIVGVLSAVAYGATVSESTAVTTGVLGATVSSERVVEPVEESQFGLVTVAIGSAPIDAPVPIHVTVPVASAGDGVHVIFGIERVFPEVTPVHVIVTSAPPDAVAGVAVHDGVAGGIESTVSVVVFAGDVFPAVSVAVTERV